MTLHGIELFDELTPALVPVRCKGFNVRCKTGVPNGVAKSFTPRGGTGEFRLDATDVNRDRIQQEQVNDQVLTHEASQQRGPGAMPGPLCDVLRNE